MVTSLPDEDPVAVGGAHIDRRGRCRAPMCRLPPTPARHARGCRRRRLQRAAQCGAARRRRPRCCRCAAATRPARRLPRAIAAAGIADLSAVFLDRATPSYTALLDREGELIVGFADMALYELAFPKQLTRPRCARRSLRPTPSCATPTCRHRRWSGWLPACRRQARSLPSRSRRPRSVRLKPVLGRLAVAVHEPARGREPGRRGWGSAAGGRRRRAGAQPASPAAWSRPGSGAGHRVSTRPALFRLDAAAGRDRSSTSPAPAMRWPARRWRRCCAACRCAQALREGMAAATAGHRERRGRRRLHRGGLRRALALVPEAGRRVA